MMTTSLHTILSRSKDHPARRAMLSDFELDIGTAASADRAVTELGWSLYCLHQDSRRAVFVRTAPNADLSATPFMRMAQYNHATHVLLVPWDQLDALSARVPLPDNMIFVFGIGRSGTTLVSRMLGSVEGVQSLSEPNAQFDPTMLREANGPEVTRQLIACCTRLLCRQPDGTIPQTIAFKLYSQSLFSCMDYYSNFPDAKYVFLYRDGLGWANSVFKMTKSYGMENVMDEAKRKHLWRVMSAECAYSILEERFRVPDGIYVPEDIFAVAWALHLEFYVTCLDAGVPFLALRYNDMNTDREGRTRALLAHCGLSVSSAASALKGFEQDSQEGSGIGQDNAMKGFTSENRTRFLATLGRQRSSNNPDLILPDIYRRT